ncbi:class I SAM-dependent methyltransferase [Chitinophaga qingshengii]|uniref:Class I SAM-dependent methyltransferase n=1 Tax=Chitinophaga qingshengii TaxID=1569794 RepID=A0ABR7TVA8_9BACT|nr:class I SAM-dependent methyltransferase [Chitinophaga qingshengii]MBC9934432.1 class I SAM-dependent methyltransferase [Chitinophaga qingshengii]
MKLLQKSLLEKFVQIREEVAGITNAEMKKEQIMAAALDVCDKYEGILASNYKEVMEYQLSIFSFDIDALIAGMAEEVQSSFDLETLHRETTDDFDSKYGSRTGVIIEQIELPEQVSEDRIKYAARFHPSPVKIVQQALQDLVKYQVHYPEWTFIDIGSGLGRNLLLASQQGFKRIIGVEISSYLCEQALSNIEKYNAIEKTKCEAEIFNVDVLDFKFPAGNTVMYFWEPFTVAVQSKFIQGLEKHVAATPYQVVLIFLGTVFPGIIQSEFFKQAGKYQYPGEKNRDFEITYFQKASR